MVYPNLDSKLVSTVQYVPKKEGMIVVSNDKNMLIPLRLVTGWRVCIDYRKLNSFTLKDKLPKPFMDHMLDQLVERGWYYFLDR